MLRNRKFTIYELDRANNGTTDAPRIILDELVFRRTLRSKSSLLRDSIFKDNILSSSFIRLLGRRVVFFTLLRFLFYKTLVIYYE